MIGNIMPINRQRAATHERPRKSSVMRATKYSGRVLRHRDHHHGLLPSSCCSASGRLFRPMAWTVAPALLGALTFSILVVPCWPPVFPRASRNGGTRPDVADRALSTGAAAGD